MKVVDEGANPTGTHPVVPVTGAPTVEDTVFSFPEGKYLLEGQECDALSTFGLWGPGATLLARARQRGNWITSEHDASVQLQGFTLDQTANAGPCVFLRAAAGLFVREIYDVGLHESAARAVRFSSRPRAALAGSNGSGGSRLFRGAADAITLTAAQ